MGRALGWEVEAQLCGVLFLLLRTVKMDLLMVIVKLINLESVNKFLFHGDGNKSGF